MIGTQAQDWPTVHQSAEMQALRDYVTAADGYRYANQAASTLRLDVTHSNLIQRWHDLVFDSSMTVGRVKEKLYFHGGTPAEHQELYLRRGGGDTLFLWDEKKTLADYGVKNGMELHIKDTNPYSLSANGGLEDVSQVQKYVMADEEYDKLENSVRAVKRREKEKAAAERAARIAAGDVSARITVGSRCQVHPGGRRGEVAFVGSVRGAKGVWIGVGLDEPQGNNDGSKAGEHYFDCKGEKYGCFVRPDNVEVGDFPELDPFASDEEF
ncbi:unnamed protein product [Cladocopium goreaui]|uniref:Tubulin-folding cofactor B n=1 Tax=Cladocopium goreaui TaxID=2562237 RepID=A0A9P1GJG6_9DINO|nr:unnamed protein product [Cladocopium goreaui]